MNIEQLKRFNCLLQKLIDHKMSQDDYREYRDLCDQFMLESFDNEPKSPRPITSNKPII